MPRRAVTAGRGEDDGDGGDRSRVVAGLAGAPLTSRCRFDRRRHCCSPHGPDKAPRLMGYLFLFIPFCLKKKKKNQTEPNGEGAPYGVTIIILISRRRRYNIMMMMMIIMRSTVQIPTAILI